MEGTLKVANENAEALSIYIDKMTARSLSYSSQCANLYIADFYKKTLDATGADAMYLQDYYFAEMIDIAMCLDSGVEFTPVAPSEEGEEILLKAVFYTFGKAYNVEIYFTGSIVFYDKSKAELMRLKDIDFLNEREIAKIIQSFSTPH